MLCFSDYVLSKKPWSYCRLNETDDIFCYNDISGNGNHLYSSIVNGSYIRAATNQIASTFTGDPGIKAIQPLEVDREWGIDEILDAPDTALHFRVPEFKSEVKSYKDGVLSQSNVCALPMWIDFQWSPHPEAIVDLPSKCYESFLYFGPFVLLAETVDENTVSLQILHKNLDVWVLDWSRNVSSNPFTAGMHRFVIGIEPTKLKLSIDGSAFTDIIVDDENLNFYEQTTYSNITLLNKTAFSNVAVFFKTPLPTTEWLSGSQEVLNSTYRSARTELSSEFLGFTEITKTPGTLFNLLDKILLIGDYHESVISLIRAEDPIRLQITDCNPIINPVVGSSITIGSNHCSVYDGCWLVNSITTNSIIITPLPIKREEAVTGSISSGITIISNTTLTVYIRHNHNFRPGDIVSLGFVSDSLNHTWTVATSGGGTFTVNAVNSPASMTFNGGCIVKKMPIGGGLGWDKTYTDDDTVSYTPTINYVTPKKITIKNDNERYSVVKLSSLDGTQQSDELYFMCHDKHSYIRDLRVPWKAIGDKSRFYLVMSARQKSVSQAQILCAGEMQGWYNKIWRFVILGSQSNLHGQDCGFNYAFDYPQWTILPSGLLLCQSITTSPSDALWKVDDSTYKNYKGYQDAGQHLYPIF